MHRIEIITIGDELVEGRLVDTNAALLSARLADAGYRVARHVSVGDDRGEIVDALRAAAGRSDAVLVSGGLGPTDDDLTAEAAAEAFGRKILRHAEALDHVREFFAERGRRMTKNNEKQADLPSGCELMANPHGTATGFRIVADGCRLSFMPGVPRELEAMFAASVLPDLQSTFPGRPPLVWTLKVFGKGESEVAQMLEGLVEDLPDGTDFTVQYRASFPEIHLRLVLPDDHGEPGRVVLQRIAEEASRRLAKYLFASGEGEVVTSLGDRVISDFRRAGVTFAAADAGTGGVLAQLIVDAPGSSEVFRGGVIAPSVEDRARLLGTPPDTTADGDPASPDLAEAMADSVRERCGADLGVAVVGLPGAGDDFLEGRLVVAIAGATGRSSRDFDFPLEPGRFRSLAAHIALAMLRQAVAEAQSQ
jgi:nicotinamide-nucleotide amidase